MLTIPQCKWTQVRELMLVRDKMVAGEDFHAKRPPAPALQTRGSSEFCMFLMCSVLYCTGGCLGTDVAARLSGVEQVDPGA